MRTQVTTNIATYGVLTIAAAASILLPASLGPRQTTAAPPVATGDTVLEVNTVVRDFKKGTPDFGSGISGGNGHYAGNVSPELTSAGKPNFVGVTLSPVTDFNITNGATVPNVAYTPMVTVIGSNMDTGSYLMPVTLKVHIGSSTIEPFGSFTLPISGNVDTKTGNPRRYIHPSTVDAKTPIFIESTSWKKKSGATSTTKNTDFQTHMTVSSSPSTIQVKVLRNGDTAPNTAGYGSQASAASYLKDYINATTKKVTLQDNQTIYLFELYTTKMTDSTADFQDLVVIVTLGKTTSYLNTLDTDGTPATVTTPKGYKVASEWRDSKGNPIPPALSGTMPGDVAGSKGSASTGGITSTSSFDQWYADVMGTNLSNQVSLKLKKNNDVWEYLTDDFHPIDGAMFGNEGKEHNYYFTLNFGIDFTHHAGEHRFFEFQGDDDVWVFVDGKLAIDLGGISPGVRQYLDVDRLGLSDGQKHHIDFFYAQRQEDRASFRLRTNLDLGAGTTETYTITAAGD